MSSDTLTAPDVDPDAAPHQPDHTGREAATAPSWWAVGAAALSAAAGAVHFALVPHHAADWLTEGLAFGVVGAGQVALAVAVLFGATRRRLVLLALLNAAPPVLWMWSTSVGLPVGPGADVPEPADFLGRVTAAAEVLAVVLAVVAAARLRHAVTGRTVGRPRSAGVAIVGAALAATGVLLALPVAAHGGGADGHGHGGHSHTELPDRPLTSAQRVQLGKELAVTRSLAAKYPTGAAATAAGFTPAGPLAPGAGAHFVNLALMDGLTRFDPRTPLAYLFDGTGPGSHLTGVMYFVLGDRPPAGFTGPNDHWHRHTGICFKVVDGGKINVPFRSDADTTPAMCDSIGGKFLEQTGWMLHVWTVPGWESANGLFSHDNPAIVCPTGTALRADHPERGCAAA